MSDNSSTDPNKPSGPKGKGPNFRMSRGLFGWLILIGFALAMIFLITNRDGGNTITINTFFKHLRNQDIKKLTLHDDSITGELKSSEGAPAGSRRFTVKFPPGAIEYGLLKDIETTAPDAEVTREPSNNLLLNALVTLIPWLLIIAFIWFFVFRQMRGAGGGGGLLGNFGHSKHRIATKEHTNVTFNDVAGIDESKEEVTEIVEFLKNPKKFQRLGGRIPRGVLLVGEPGCGKTLLAKAIAGEAEVPFFSISGSDFVEMFVGVGASRVRDLFKQARENSPCIIFLDEIDAVGRRRGSSFVGGGHDEREQTLNAILVAMDGFDTSDQIIVIAATNRVDVLDPALVRPGRFDRQVFVPLPDVKGRLAILKVHAGKILLGPNVELLRLARGTPMFSGADLAAIINEAALIATMHNKDFVEMEDLEEARDKVRWGRARTSREVDERERLITAYHEAGHALIQAMEKDADPLHKVSIIPRGNMGGATFSLPEKDRQTFSQRFLMATIRVTLGGRLAEEIFCNDISSGAAGDIRQATEIARRMVTDWGMNEKVGFVYYGRDDNGAGPFEWPSSRTISDSTAELIDQEVKKLLDTALSDARAIMLANRGKVEAIAKALLVYETLSGEEVHKLVRGERLVKSSVADLLDDERATPVKPAPAKPASQNRPDPGLGAGPLPQPG